MNDNTLTRSRTVRLSSSTDRLLLAEAARLKKNVSDLIREKIEANLGQHKTAAARILEIAGMPRRRDHADEFKKAFRASYTRRHQP
jgi:hypothetical protein